MPIITVKIAKGRPTELKQRLVEAIAREVEEILEINKEYVTVLIDEYDRENWSTGGELHSIKYGQGFGKQGVQSKKIEG